MYNRDSRGEVKPWALCPFYVANPCVRTGEQKKVEKLNIKAPFYRQIDTRGCQGSMHNKLWFKWNEYNVLLFVVHRSILDRLKIDANYCYLCALLLYHSPVYTGSCCCSVSLLGNNGDVSSLWLA